MTQKQIERKCQDYSKSATPSFVNGTFDRYAIAQAFEDAAKWRIESVWHKPDEKPEVHNGDLLVIVEDAFGKEVSCRQNAYYVLRYGCVKWAYIKGLLPEEE